MYQLSSMYYANANVLCYNSIMKDIICAMVNCNKVIYTKKSELCISHYMRKRRNGTPTGLRKMREVIIGDVGRQHPLYRTWSGMIQRCTNPNNTYFFNYGGRGVKVCDEWRNSFNAFATYMGDKPGASYTLDRIDNNGNYEPGNVRWANKSEQQLNRGMRADNISGVNGVSHRKDTGKWVARIAVEGVVKRKQFDSMKDAVEQRLKWEKELI